MIIIKGENEAELISKIEGALRGEDVEMYASEEAVTLEQIASSIAYNALRARVYIGRLVGHNQRQVEVMRELNKLLTPISEYATIKLAQELELDTRQVGKLTLHQKLARQREVQAQLEKEGKTE